jgi:hypothetical protein
VCPGLAFKGVLAFEIENGLVRLTRASLRLAAASLVRMKLFTLDSRFILRRLGQLAAADRKAVAASMKTLLT